MKLLRATILLLLLMFAAAGCGLASSEDAPASRFQATLAGMPWNGEARADRLPAGVRIRGIQGDFEAGNYDYIRLSLPDFSGPGTYALDEGEAAHGTVIGRDGIAVYGTATDGAVTIEAYDTASGTIRGTFAFEGVAQRDFSSVQRGSRFNASGTFMAQVEDVR